MKSSVCEGIRLVSARRFYTEVVCVLLTSGWLVTPMWLKGHQKDNKLNINTDRLFKSVCMFWVKSLNLLLLNNHFSYERFSSLNAIEIMYLENMYFCTSSGRWAQKWNISLSLFPCLRPPFVFISCEPPGCGADTAACPAWRRRARSVCRITFSNLVSLQIFLFFSKWWNLGL